MRMNLGGLTLRAHGRPRDPRTRDDEHAHAGAAQRAHGSRRVGPHGIRELQHAGQVPVRCHPYARRRAVAAAASAFAVAAAAVVRVGAVRARPCAAADGDLRAVHTRAHARAGLLRHAAVLRLQLRRACAARALSPRSTSQTGRPPPTRGARGRPAHQMRRRRGRACRAGRRNHGARERVRGAALHGRGEREQARRVHAAGRPHRGHARPARRQCARLVQHDRVHARGSLQRVAAADEQAPARARPPLASAGRRAQIAVRARAAASNGGRAWRGSPRAQAAGGGARPGRAGAPRLRAPTEVPTRTAVGVARPSAQGQATTSTLHARCAASSRARARGAAAAPARAATICRRAARPVSPGPGRRDKATSRSTARARAELRQAAREGRAA